MVVFSSDRMSYITLRSHWCDTVLNMHAIDEDRSGYMKDSFCGDL